MNATIRRELLSVLAQGPRSVRDLSLEARIPEKEVYGHLEHISMSLQRTGQRFAVIPAECRNCGFVFSKRSRLRKPGKCPVCKGESIRDPLFSVEK